MLEIFNGTVVVFVGFFIVKTAGSTSDTEASHRDLSHYYDLMLKDTMVY